MIKGYQQGLQEELGIIVSLAVSIGVIMLAVFGWWMWTVLARIVEAMFILPPSEMP